MIKNIEEINTDIITEDTVFVIKVDTTNMPREYVIEFMEKIRVQVAENLKPGRVLIVDSKIDITKLSMSELINQVEGKIGDEESK